ncbi:single-stranded DNA-binding protein [Mahella sp.]|uniref:single-stranded DNA-binding protein n=1 Tax=Mahella sp. TaxID=2798721 RepID=UPI0025C1045D|nr:single-stranded DNA-binding protein [Mahella sp.]MBZ4666624.1 single-strand binding protein/Primosomal replication protein n [Mahella sp.]
MVTYGCDTNSIILAGIVQDDLQYSHQIYGEGFYTFHLSVPRISAYKDILPITLSERLLNALTIHIGDSVVIEGQIRSYNKFIDGGNRLIITVFARDIKLVQEDDYIKNPNQVFLDGFICKQPVYRVTPLNREISDLLLAVNRSYNKSDYVPCIAWGRNARFCSNLKIGERIKIWGRLQSREYQKHISEQEVINKTTYEVSIAKLELADIENENKG